MISSRCRAVARVLVGVRLVSSDSAAAVSTGTLASSQQVSAGEPASNQHIEADATGKKKWSNWLYEAEFSALVVRLGHKVEDVPSVAKALRQESHMKTISGQGSHTTKQAVMKPNRLSVLGRSTMMHYVNEYLYFSYPKMDGSMLLDLANSITNQEALVKLANHFGVTDLIKAGVNVELPENAEVISESFCGILGAIYEDQGPKSARKLVHEIVVPQLSEQDFEQVVKMEHPRLMLNAILRELKRPKPVARLISESGRATHFPSFVVGVFSGENCLGEGTGTSLRRAEHEAMLTALRSHFQKELSAIPLPSEHDELFTEGLENEVKKDH